MGGVGTARASQIIQYADIIDKNEFSPTTEYIITSLVPIIATTLKANGIVIDPTPESELTGITIPNAFIFAYGNKAWLIWHDLSVQEITEDYLAIGSGSEVAKGALFATQDGKNPFERIVLAIQAAAETTLYVDEDVNLLVTEIRKPDQKQIAAAFGFSIEELKEIPVEKPEQVEETK